MPTYPLYLLSVVNPQPGTIDCGFSGSGWEGGDFRGTFAGWPPSMEVTDGLPAATSITADIEWDDTPIDDEFQFAVTYDDLATGLQVNYQSYSLSPGGTTTTTSTSTTPGSTTTTTTSTTTTSGPVQYAIVDFTICGEPTSSTTTTAPPCLPDWSAYCALGCPAVLTVQPCVIKQQAFFVGTTDLSGNCPIPIGISYSELPPGFSWVYPSPVFSIIASGWARNYWQVNANAYQLGLIWSGMTFNIVATLDDGYGPPQTVTQVVTIYLTNDTSQCVSTTTLPPHTTRTTSTTTTPPPLQPVAYGFDFRVGAWTDLSDPALAGSVFFPSELPGQYPELLMGTQYGYTDPISGQPYNGALSVITQVDPTVDMNILWQSPWFEFGRSDYSKRFKRLRITGNCTVGYNQPWPTVTVTANTPGQVPDIVATFPLTGTTGGGGNDTTLLNIALPNNLYGRRLYVTVQGIVQTFELHECQVQWVYLRRDQRL